MRNTIVVIRERSGDSPTAALKQPPACARHSEVCASHILSCNNLHIALLDCNCLHFTDEDRHRPSPGFRRWQGKSWASDPGILALESELPVVPGKSASKTLLSEHSALLPEGSTEADRREGSA